MDQYQTHKGPPTDIQQTPEVFRGSLNVIAIQKLTLLKKNHNDDNSENYGLTYEVVTYAAQSKKWKLQQWTR